MSDDRAAYWDQRYRERGFLWGTEPNRFLVEVASDLLPGRALDLACGQGRNSVWLAQRGHTVTGLDLSPVAIGHAEELARQAGVVIEFHAVDLTTWQPEGRTWDLVVLSYLQVVAEDRRLIHERAEAAVAAGGTLIVIAHHLDNLTAGVGGPQSPEVLYTCDDLIGDFPGLSIERCERVLRPVESEEISGEAIDVLLVASRAAR
ncbi:MAG: class I SAM-dependent methyltransferase [Actinobacteria bacterium]|nr:MAG: class I SAM-dependent methyltransferase [Actinomycetota bacterium]